MQLYAFCTFFGAAQGRAAKCSEKRRNGSLTLFGGKRKKMDDDLFFSLPAQMSGEGEAMLLFIAAVIAAVMTAVYISGDICLWRRGKALTRAGSLLLWLMGIGSGLEALILILHGLGRLISLL